MNKHDIQIWMDTNMMVPIREIIILPGTKKKKDTHLQRPTPNHAACHFSRILHILYHLNSIEPQNHVVNHPLHFLDNNSYLHNAAHNIHLQSPFEKKPTIYTPSCPM